MAKATAKKKGAPRRVFTAQEADIVKLLSIGRTPHTMIAKAIRTDKETLYKNFREILDIEKLKFDAIVIGKMAKAITEGDRAMIMFYLKCQCGWRETDNNNNVVEIPAQIQVELIKKADD